MRAIMISYASIATVVVHSHLQGDLMSSFMRPYVLRTPDHQYMDAVRMLVDTGLETPGTPQGVSCLTSFEVPKLVYRFENGFPMITERSVERFWKTPIDELFSFIRGETTFSGLEKAGCHWWNAWKENAIRMGLPPNSLGPASYGGAFATFPTHDGGHFDQFAHLLEQIRIYPDARTLFVSPWIPYMIGRGDHMRQGAVVAPCHGWVHVRIIKGKLILHMLQRSADILVGVPANMIQYAALTLALADLLDLVPYQYVHSFSDAHIYSDQQNNLGKLLERKPNAFPTVRLTQKVTDLFSVTSDFFELDDYHPHPGMKIPVAV